jgi:uncharacterized protein YaaQ
MKLIFAIVQDDDALSLNDTLNEEGFRVTKLATTGGFLKEGNTTLIVGVDDEKVNHVLARIEEVCRTREQIVVSTAPATIDSGGFIPFPVEIEVGGAVVFVVDVDKYIKI